MTSWHDGLRVNGFARRGDVSLPLITRYPLRLFSAQIGLFALWPYPHAGVLPSREGKMPLSFYPAAWALYSG